jgi:hypothetical protein
MTPREQALIKMLSKDKIISIVLDKKKNVLGIARAGTNRGKSSQLYKYVKEAQE